MYLNRASTEDDLSGGSAYERLDIDSESPLGLTSDCHAMYIRILSPRSRKLYSFWIDPDQASGLKAVKERDGVPESEQIRRAIDRWLKAKNVSSKTAPRRALTRRRA